MKEVTKTKKKIMINYQTLQHFNRYSNIQIRLVKRKNKIQQAYKPIVVPKKLETKQNNQKYQHQTEQNLLNITNYEQNTILINKIQSLEVKSLIQQYSKIQERAIQTTRDLNLKLKGNSYDVIKNLQNQNYLDQEEIENLKSQIQTLQEEKKNSQNEKFLIMEQKKQNPKLHQNSQSVNELQVQLKNAQTQIEQLLKENESQRQDLHHNQNEKEVLLRQIKAKQSYNEELEIQYQELQYNIQDLNEKIIEQTDIVQYWKCRYEAMVIQLNNQNIKERPNSNQSQNSNYKPQSGRLQSCRPQSNKQRPQSGDYLRRSNSRIDKNLLCYILILVNNPESKEVKIIFQNLKYRLMKQKISVNYLDLFLFDNDKKNTGVSDKKSIQSALNIDPFCLSVEDAQLLTNYIMEDEGQNSDILYILQQKIPQFQFFDQKEESELYKSIIEFFKNSQLLNQSEDQPISPQQILIEQEANDYLFMNLVHFSGRLQDVTLKQFVYSRHLKAFLLHGVEAEKFFKQNLENSCSQQSYEEIYEEFD